MCKEALCRPSASKFPSLNHASNPALTLGQSLSIMANQAVLKGIFLALIPRHRRFSALPRHDFVEAAEASLLGTGGEIFSGMQR